LPYDWRLSFDNVVNRGYEASNGYISYTFPFNQDEITPYMIKQLSYLAATSKSGNVTLVTHSMGGLVAKTLLMKLEEMKSSKTSDLIDHIDRLIMVAPPQLGTPKAVASLLHGDKQSIPPRFLGVPTGFILNNTLAREFGKNMPGAYSLIPSRKYFEIVDTNAQPIIEFDEKLADIPELSNRAGANITTPGNLYRFITTGNDGAWSEGRAALDIDVPNVLNPFIMTNAENTHNSIDSWEPQKRDDGTPSIEVIQIAGWGEDTIRGIRYDDCDTFLCTNTLEHLDRELLETEDGDGTVVVPSATAMDLPNTTFYVKLPDYNRELLFLRRNRDHADIMEVEDIQELIKQIINNTLDFTQLPDNIYTGKPEPKEEDNKLRLRVHSPISIDVYDSFGNHTGLIPNPDPTSNIQVVEAQIPNSYYYEVGEKKYLGLDTKDEYQIEIKGLALGTFTIEIDQVWNDELQDTTSYADIPVSPNTIGLFTTQFVDTTSPLSLDTSGDGKPDVTVKPAEKPDPLVSLGVLKNTIKSLSIHKAVKNALIKQIEAAENILKKQPPKKLPEFGKATFKDGLYKAADGILKGMIIQLKNFPSRLIAPADAQALIQIIETIRTSTTQ